MSSNNYGVVEEIFETKKSGGRTASMGKDITTRRVQEKPGISPLLIPHFLLENSVYLWISDISTELPSYTEQVEIVEMADDQAIIYKEFEKELMKLVQEALRRRDHRLLGALVNSLYALPDGARRGEIVYDPDSKGEFRTPLCEAIPLDISMLPKEERLKDLILAEKRLGRKCAVFLEHTGTRDLILDITERLEQHGIRSLILRSDTVETCKREEWIKKMLKVSDPDVLICNPNLVKTGLDLLEFPTIIYFQAGMSIYTLRQSSRRSWRIGQKNPVRVHFMAYADTAQERALKLIATKLETSNAVEGKLSADGLSSMSEGDSSLILELARSIMGGDKDKRSFRDVWEGYLKSETTKDVSLTNTEDENVAEQGIEEAIAVSSVSARKEIAPSRTLMSIMEFARARKVETPGRASQISVFDLLETMEELKQAS